MFSFLAYLGFLSSLNYTAIIRRVKCFFKRRDRQDESEGNRWWETRAMPEVYKIPLCTWFRSFPLSGLRNAPTGPNSVSGHGDKEQQSEALMEALRGPVSGSSRLRVTASRSLRSPRVPPRLLAGRVLQGSHCLQTLPKQVISILDFFFFTFFLIFLAGLKLLCIFFGGCTACSFLVSLPLPAGVTPWCGF